MALGVCCVSKAIPEIVHVHTGHCPPLHLEKEAEGSGAPSIQALEAADAAGSLPLPQLSQLLFLHLKQSPLNL